MGHTYNGLREKHRTRTIYGTKKSTEHGQYVGQRKAQNKDNMWDKEKHRTWTICGTKKSLKQGQYVGQRKA